MRSSTSAGARVHVAQAALVVVWTSLSAAWLTQDRLVRDGDEEGHVGAAELFAADLQEGQWLAFLERLWIGPMGEYPQAFSALVGAWWWLLDGGLPGRVAVRAVCLLSLGVTALATAALAARFVEREHRPSAAIIAMLSVFCLPMANGLTRHFMPEGLLMAMVAVSLLAAQRWTERPSLSRGLALGAALGVGLLTKQTFPLYIALPLGLLCRRHCLRNWPSVGLAVAVALAIAGPWWTLSLQGQLDYLSASTVGHGSGGPVPHLFYYPKVLLILGFGPPLTVAGLIAAVGLRGRLSAQTRHGLWVATVWLVAGLALLVLIPKKYPRLLTPLTPSIAVLIALAWVRRERVRPALAVALACATLWTVHASVTRTPALEADPAIDPGCPQHWLRGPSDNDLGLAEVTAALATMPEGAITITADLPIPCALQTTHDWSSHLRPYLRRSGVEREVEVSSDPKTPVTIEVSSGRGGIPIVGTKMSVHIRDTLRP